MTGRKILRSIENPLDNIFIDIAECLNPFFYNLGFTPNLLTTLSLLFSIYGVYLIGQGRYKVGSILYLIGYFFDCTDGNFARRYKMTSKYGDLYDHASDVAKAMHLFWMILNLPISSIKNRLLLIIFFIIVHLVSFVHIGCQEKETHNSESKSISFLHHLCPDSNYIHVTRYFGTGTAYLIICLCLFFLPEVFNLFNKISD
jgi:phosphatidylglycerophosphate synthase